MEEVWSKGVRCDRIHRREKQVGKEAPKEGSESGGRHSVDSMG